MCDASFYGRHSIPQIVRTSIERERTFPWALPGVLALLEMDSGLEQHIQRLRQGRGKLCGELRTELGLMRPEGGTKQPSQKRAGWQFNALLTIPGQGDVDHMGFCGVCGEDILSQPGH
jgi:hypothetical protein